MSASRASPEAYDEALQTLSLRVAELECELRAVSGALERLTASAWPRDGHNTSAGAAGWAGASAVPRDGHDHDLCAASTADDRWRVTMLGRFRIERGGAEAPVCSSRRGRSILKYLLASRGHAVLQPVLVETFWPGAAPAAGAHNLQMAVHALRHSLTGWGPRGGDDAVLFRQDTYLLHPDLSIEQDIDRYRHAYASGERALAQGDTQAARRAFEAAHSLYGGDFLSDSPYEDWAQTERAALQDAHLCTLAHLARLYVGMADLDRAAACCSAILVIDPYREDAYRQLMRCEAQRGRRAHVRTVFETCASRLRHDLHVQPAPETRRLYEQLLAD